jgi:hypothetical protein
MPTERARQARLDCLLDDDVMHMVLRSAGLDRKRFLAFLEEIAKRLGPQTEAVSPA